MKVQQGKRREAGEQGHFCRAVWVVADVPVGDGSTSSRSLQASAGTPTPTSGAQKKRGPRGPRSWWVLLAETNRPRSIRNCPEGQASIGRRSAPSAGCGRRFA